MTLSFSTKEELFASDVFDDPEHAMDFYSEMQGNKQSLELKLQMVRMIKRPLSSERPSSLCYSTVTSNMTVFCHLVGV